MRTIRDAAGGIFCAVLVASTAVAGVPEALRQQAWYPKAPALAKPSGKVIRAASVAEIYAAAGKLAPGETILLADGHYRMTHTLVLRADNTTLRSESGDRAKVVLDFAHSRHGEGVAISHATGVTIADLTVQNVSQNGIKINSDLGADRATIYNVVSHNVWQRHVKGPKVPDKDGRPQWVHGCRVQYCLFYNDRPKKRGDDPWEDGNHGSRMHYNYVGGIDVMCADGWTISDNVFLGIQGKTRECRGAVFLWHNTKDCLVERNVFTDCDTGIALGNSSARGDRRHCTGVIVRNNFVTRCRESNILADHTRDCVIVHNTVHDPTNRMGRLLRVLHASDGLVARNNLFSGPRISIEKHTGTIDVSHNLIKRADDWFVNPTVGNLHLTAKAKQAIDQAQPRRDVPDDIDRTPRGAKPDMGADEFGEAATQDPT